MARFIPLLMTGVVFLAGAGAAGAQELFMEKVPLAGGGEIITQHLLAKHPPELQGFSLSVTFDPAVYEVLKVTWKGTAVEEALPAGTSPEFWTAPIDGVDGHFIVACILSFTSPLVVAPAVDAPHALVAVTYKLKAPYPAPGSMVPSMYFENGHPAVPGGPGVVSDFTIGGKSFAPTLEAPIFLKMAGEPAPPPPPPPTSPSPTASPAPSPSPTGSPAPEPEPEPEPIPAPEPEPEPEPVPAPEPVPPTTGTPAPEPAPTTTAPPPPDPVVDTLAPPPVTVTVISWTYNSATLQWSAPPDDPGAAGTQVASYRVKYRVNAPIASITEFNTLATDAIDVEPLPMTAGSTQEFTVTGLVENTLYCFALLSVDEAGNASLSNSPQVLTPPEEEDSGDPIEPHPPGPPEEDGNDRCSQSSGAGASVLLVALALVARRK